MLHGRSSIFHVWERLISGKRREIVRFDFESAVTRRYDRSEIAAAMAGFPCTTACSPKTITFPGADTINGGIIGEDCFLTMGVLFFPLFEPLILAFSILSLIIVTRSVSIEVLSRAGIREVGEVEGLRVLSELEGVITRSDFVVVLELDRECCFISRGSPRDLFVFVPPHNQVRMKCALFDSLKRQAWRNK